MKKTATLVLTLAFAAPALAQDDPPREATEFTFGDAERVEGGRSTPWGDRLRGRIPRPRRSLIRPRTSFVQELLKSANDT